MTGKSGQRRVTHKRALPLEEYRVLAQGLLGEFETYYGAAKAIGDRNLRAGFRRLLLMNHPPSKRLRDALEDWANIKRITLVMPTAEWERHTLRCAVCGRRCVRWSGNQRYCSEHSWATPEGRRWHRQHKEDKG